MSDNLSINPLEAELVERIKLLLFSVKLPLQRLEADIDDIGRFTAPDGRSPQLRLIEAMPPLTPAAEAIVLAMIRAYGIELFAAGSANAVMRAMIKAGPTRFAQTALTLDPDTPGPKQARQLISEFNRIFERYPERGFCQARQVLSALGLSIGRDTSRCRRSKRDGTTSPDISIQEPD